MLETATPPQPEAEVVTTSNPEAVPEAETASTQEAVAVTVTAPETEVGGSSPGEPPALAGPEETAGVPAPPVATTSAPGISSTVTQTRDQQAPPHPHTKAPGASTASSTSCWGASRGRRRRPSDRS